MKKQSKALSLIHGSHKSPANMAWRLGQIIPPKPLPVGHDEMELERYIRSCGNCAVTMLQHICRSNTSLILTFNRPSDSTSSKGNVIPVNPDDIDPLDPTGTIDRLSGRILLAQSARSSLGPRMLGRVWNTAVCGHPPKNTGFIAAHALLGNVVSRNLSIYEVSKNRPGWVGYTSCTLPTEYKEILGQMRDEKMDPLVRCAISMVCRMHIGIPHDTGDPKLDEAAAFWYGRLVSLNNARSLSGDIEALLMALISMLGVTDHSDPKEGLDYIAANAWGSFIPLKNIPGSPENEPEEAGEGESTEDKAKGGSGSKSALGDMVLDTSSCMKKPLDDNKGTCKKMPVRYSDCRNIPVPDNAGCSEHPGGHNALVRQFMRSMADLAASVIRPPVPEYGHKSGDLDEGSLHMGTTDDRLFYRLPEEETGSVHVAILLDCSGSMGSRIFVARAATEALARLLGRRRRTKVSLFGHTATYERVTVKQVTIGTTLALSAGGENGDGYAIEWVRNYLLHQRADRRIFINISDGLPSVNGRYHGSAAYQHVRDACSKTRSSRIDLIAIGLDHCIPAATGKFMYGPKYMNSLTAELPKVLPRWIKGVLKPTT